MNFYTIIGTNQRIKDSEFQSRQDKIMELIGSETEYQHHIDKLIKNYLHSSTTQQ